MPEQQNNSTKNFNLCGAALIAVGQNGGLPKCTLLLYKFFGRIIDVIDFIKFLSENFTGEASLSISNTIDLTIDLFRQ